MEPVTLTLIPLGSVITAIVVSHLAEDFVLKKINSQYNCHVSGGKSLPPQIGLGLE